MQYYLCILCNLYIRRTYINKFIYLLIYRISERSDTHESHRNTKTNKIDKQKDTRHSVQCQSVSSHANHIAKPNQYEYQQQLKRNIAKTKKKKPSKYLCKCITFYILHSSLCICIGFFDQHVCRRICIIEFYRELLCTTITNHNVG